MSKRFIVTSHGWSASNWLAYALNLHPDIVCSHSARNLLADEKGMNSDENLKKHLAELHKGYLSRQERPLDTAYNEIIAMGPAEMHGSVHVYRLRDLPVVVERFGVPEQVFSVMNLVRHPISLVWSGYGQFKELFKYDLNELHWTSGKVLREGRTFLYQLAEKYSLNVGELENLAFIGASVVLGSLRLDLDALERIQQLPCFNFLGHIKMEEVTRKPERLSETIDLLSEDVINANGPYLKKVYDAGVINEHKQDKNKFDPEARYNQFSSWQRETFQYFFDKYNLQSAYEQIGYQFNFLSR